MGRLGWYLATTFAISLLVVVLIELMQARWRFGKTVRWLGRHPVCWLAGGLLAQSLMVAISAITGSFAAGVAIGGLAALVMGYVNLLMLLYRDQPLVPRDMVMALNINQLAAMVSPLFVGILALVVGVAVGLFLLLNQLLPPVAWPHNMRLRVAAAGVLLFMLFLSMGHRRSPLRKLLQGLGEWGADFRSYRINTFGSYARNGFLLAFCSQVGIPMMRKPKGYSKEAVREAAQLYREKAVEYNRSHPQEGQPDIVFVMSEAFSDPTNLPGLAFDADPIPHIRAWMDALPSGKAVTPGYGGGTAHCEFEALTGFSVALCGGASPYESVVAIRERFPSLVAALREAGYATTALHPYTDAMYARPKAYAALGFDRFLIHTDMKRQDKLEHSPYISDESAYNEVLDLLEVGAKPHFIHLVTMQNHGEYPPGRYQNTIAAAGLPQPVVHRFLETYVQGLRYTDEATHRFLQALEKRSRPTVVVFWGDHLPGGYPGEFLESCGRKKFETPCFLWSNRPVEAVDWGRRNPLFFRHLLCEAACIPKTPFDILLGELEQKIHAIHMDFVVDSREHSSHAIPAEAKPLLEIFRLMQYDAIEGEGYGAECGFFSHTK